MAPQSGQASCPMSPPLGGRATSVAAPGCVWVQCGRSKSRCFCSCGTRVPRLGSSPFSVSLQDVADPGLDGYADGRALLVERKRFAAEAQKALGLLWEGGLLLVLLRLWLPPPWGRFEELVNVPHVSGLRGRRRG